MVHYQVGTTVARVVQWLLGRYSGCHGDKYILCRSPSSAIISDTVMGSKKIVLTNDSNKELEHFICNLERSCPEQKT